MRNQSTRRVVMPCLEILMHPVMIDRWLMRLDEVFGMVNIGMVRYCLGIATAVVWFVWYGILYGKVWYCGHRHWQCSESIKNFIWSAAVSFLVGKYLGVGAKKARNLIHSVVAGVLHCEPVPQGSGFVQAHPTFIHTTRAPPRIGCLTWNRNFGIIIGKLGL